MQRGNGYGVDTTRALSLALSLFISLPHNHTRYILYL